MSVTIDKRPSGKYRAQVRVSGYPTQSRTFPRKAQASAWADTVERDLLDQQVNPTALSKRRTLSDAIDIYMAEAVPAKKSRKTITDSGITYSPHPTYHRALVKHGLLIMSQVSKNVASGRL
jgi:hypothetical protein